MFEKELALAENYSKMMMTQDSLKFRAVTMESILDNIINTNINIERLKNLPPDQLDDDGLKVGELLEFNLEYLEEFNRFFDMMKGGVEGHVIYLNDADKIFGTPVIAFNTREPGEEDRFGYYFEFLNALASIPAANSFIQEA